MPEELIDIYGPAPSGLPLPTFPPRREVELLFTGDPTPGIAGYVEHLLSALAFNISVRIADEGRHNLLDVLRVHEVGVERDGYSPDFDLGVIGSGLSIEASAPPMDPVVVRSPSPVTRVCVTTLLDSPKVLMSLSTKSSTSNEFTSASATSITPTS